LDAHRLLGCTTPQWLVAVTASVVVLAILFAAWVAVGLHLRAIGAISAAAVDTTSMAMMT
jgi:hypothetical protein